MLAAVCPVSSLDALVFANTTARGTPGSAHLSYASSMYKQ